MAGRKRESGRTGVLRDTVRKALTAGTAAVFMTEEGVRSVLGEMKTPRDVARYLGEQADRARHDLVAIIGAEVKNFFAHLDPAEEARKLLAGMTLEIKSEIRFVRRPRGTHREKKVRS